MHKEKSTSRSFCGHEGLNYVPFPVYEQASEEGRELESWGAGMVRGVTQGASALCGYAATLVS